MSLAEEGTVSGKPEFECCFKNHHSETLAYAESHLSHPSLRTLPEHRKAQASPGFSRFCHTVTPCTLHPRLAGCDSVTGSGTPSGSVPLGAGDPLGAGNPLGA